MVDHAGQRDALERALLELDAMACIFCNDFADEGESFEEFIITTQDALERARAYVDSPVDEILDIPQIDAEVLIHTAWGGARLRICLPPGYPSLAFAQVTVMSTPNLMKRSDHDQLSTILRCQAKDLLGSEAMMEIVNRCREEMEKMVESKPNNRDIADCTLMPDHGNTTTDTSITRCWIWVHHITNSSRLKQISIEANELKLGGYLKGGYPGVVIVEGNRTNCEEFVTWIKGNKSRPGGFGRNWGHHVRGEATVNRRQLPEVFTELEDDMGKLGKLCADHDVEDEFREFILQHK